MKRFLIFPMALGFAGALLPVLCFVIGVVSVWPLLIRLGGGASPNDIGDALPELWESSWPYGLTVGVLSGFALAGWDAIRNRRDQSSLARLGANLFWCGAYALLFDLINGALSALASARVTAPPSAEWILMLPFFSAALLGITAILWAAIRSITAKDVLTPRVLRAKLRERARLD